MDRKLSLSILGYESNLDENIPKIHELLDNGVDYLHIDIMRQPFIPERNAFSEDSLVKLIYEFDDAKLDFHIMSRDPHEIVDLIFYNRAPNGKDIITVHRESYRDNLGAYDSKDIDLSKCCEPYLIAAHKYAGNLLKVLTEDIIKRSFKAGIALEPNTDKCNICDLEDVDMVLLMGVSSGAGGQAYLSSTNDKIRWMRDRYPEAMIQVDGGINEETLPDVLEAGANNIVIGSYITGADNPIEVVRSVRAQLNVV